MKTLILQVIALVFGRRGAGYGKTAVNSDARCLVDVGVRPFEREPLFYRDLLLSPLR